MVIWTDAHLNALSKQRTGRMRSEVVHICQNFVTGRAALYTDVLLLDEFKQIRVHGQVETMADTLRPKQDCINQFLVRARVRLTSVQVKLELVSKHHLNFHNLLQEVIDWLVVVLFVNHIKARYQSWTHQLTGFHNSI